MRTTLTLDFEIAERLRAEADLGKRSFKEIVNDALRRGLGLEKTPLQKPFEVIPHSSPFLPGVDPGKLNQLADELEATEFLRKNSSP
jgi:hypothetical protein